MITTLNSHHKAGSQRGPENKVSSKPPTSPAERKGLDGFQPTSYDPAMAHLGAMRALAKLAPLNASPAQTIDQALATLAQARSHNQATVSESAQGAARLTDTGEQLRAIKFDRHTHSVAQHGNDLRGKSQDALGHAGRAQASQSETESQVEALASQLEQALRETPERSRAHTYLSRAQRDLTLMEENSLDMAAGSLQAAQNVLGEHLDPYLVEVEEDAPGRDVGRFADDIGELLGNGRSNLRATELAGDWVDRDLEEIAVSLQRAKDAL